MANFLTQEELQSLWERMERNPHTRLDPFLLERLILTAMAAKEVPNGFVAEKGEQEMAGRAQRH